ncbi:cryptococcal mannosyltransferase 1-domain-containing protein [Mycena olivaceomarginata]|nr:cryptococcal mannosyltransferase 1-domain-containing protein [Mycena olivaceomarginata]
MNKHRREPETQGRSSRQHNRGWAGGVQACLAGCNGPNVSCSSDDSPALLRAFETKLQAMSVPNRILTHNMSVPCPPWMRHGTATRNLVLEPLTVHGGYDGVLFRNDVFVEAESIVELLETNRGEYDMVCDLDFQQWGLYDIWAIRDRLGQIVSGQWLYFSGFAAVMANEPAPVFTCWNGIASIRAEPFLLPTEMRRGGLSAPPLPPLSPTHPAYPRPANQTPATAPPLRFCSSSLDECFSSESFNLLYDLRCLFGLERIYVNPRVITAYKWRFYLWFKYAMHHWVVKWFMETAEHKMGETQPTIWDSGESHPGGALHLH